MTIDEVVSKIEDLLEYRRNSLRSSINNINNISDEELVKKTATMILDKYNKNKDIYTKEILDNILKDVLELFENNDKYLDTLIYGGVLSTEDIESLLRCCEDEPVEPEDPEPEDPEPEDPEEPETCTFMYMDGKPWTNANELPSNQVPYMAGINVMQDLNFLSSEELETPDHFPSPNSITPPPEMSRHTELIKAVTHCNNIILFGVDGAGQNEYEEYKNIYYITPIEVVNDACTANGSPVDYIGPSRTFDFSDDTVNELVLTGWGDYSPTYNIISDVINYDEKLYILTDDGFIYILDPATTDGKFDNEAIAWISLKDILYDADSGEYSSMFFPAMDYKDGVLYVAMTDDDTSYVLAIDMITGSLIEQANVSWNDNKVISDLAIVNNNLHIYYYDNMEQINAWMDIQNGPVGMNLETEAAFSFNSVPGSRVLCVYDDKIVTTSGYGTIVTIDTNETDPALKVEMNRFRNTEGVYVTDYPYEVSVLTPTGMVLFKLMSYDQSDRINVSFAYVTGYVEHPPF